MKAVAFVLASAARASTHTIAEGPLRGRTLTAGEAWISVATIARWSGLRDERAARAALHRLEALGVVSVERPKGKPLVVTFDDARLATLAPIESSRSTPPVEPPLPLNESSRSAQRTPPVQRETPLPLNDSRRRVEKKSSEEETSFALALTGESGVKSEAQQSEETTRGELANGASQAWPGSAHAVAPPRPRTRSRARVANDKPAPAGHADVVAAWFAEHERARGIKPTFAAREGKLVSQLIERVGVDDAKRIIARAFADPFWASRVTLRKLVDEPDLFRGNGTTSTPRQPAAPRELVEQWERDAIGRADA